MRKLIDREEDNRQIEVKMEMLPPHEDNCQTSTDRNGYEHIFCSPLQCYRPILGPPCINQLQVFCW